MVEGHREVSTPRGHRTQGVDIAEHVRQWHHTADYIRVTARVLAFNHASAAGQIANDTASILLRRHNFDFHDRLKQFRTSFFQAVTHTGTGRYFKGQNRRVHVVEAPSIKVTLKSITGKPANGPESITDLIPFSTPGIYSFGIDPPTTLDVNE